MKKIKIIACILIIAMLGNSCQNDGGESFIPLNDGVVPNMQKLATGEAFIDLFKIEDGDPVNLEFSAEVAQGTPASTDVVGIYRTAAGPVYNATLFSGATLPQNYSLNTNDILAAFTELNSSDDIKLGDILTITTRFTMPDGTVLNIVNEDGTSNTGSNIQTTVLFASVINYPVTCPSDLGGTYLVTSTASGCCGVAPITDYEYTVTVTDNGGGSYALSDFSGGMYDGLFCTAFNICGDASGGNITDICNELSGSAPDCCGDNIVFEGTIDPTTKNWNVNISSGFLVGTSVWVKQ